MMDELFWPVVVVVVICAAALIYGIVEYIATARAKRNYRDLDRTLGELRNAKRSTPRR